MKICFYNDRPVAVLVSANQARLRVMKAGFGTSTGLSLIVTHERIGRTWTSMVCSHNVKGDITSSVSQQWFCMPREGSCGYPRPTDPKETGGRKFAADGTVALPIARYLPTRQDSPHIICPHNLFCGCHIVKRIVQEKGPITKSKNRCIPRYPSPLTRSTMLNVCLPFFLESSNTFAAIFKREAAVV